MKLTKSNFSFKSSNGVNTIRGIKIYSDEIEKIGVLQIAHGMVEHYERYLDFMEYMAQQGFVVYMADHLGHKHSVENDEDLGFFAEKNGYKYILNDMRHISKIAKRENPDLKLFLLGHSMGSFYARSFAAVYPDVLDGLLISGTGTAPGGICLAKSVLDTLMAIKGNRYRSEKINDMLFGSYVSKIDNPRTKSDWISRDNEIVDKYISDKYCQFIFTLSGFKDLVCILEMANSEKTYKNTSKKLPIYIFSGSMDPVGNYGAGVMNIFGEYKKYGMEDVTVKIYTGGRHEMLNEINKEEVYENIKNWVVKEIGE